MQESQLFGRVPGGLMAAVLCFKSFSFPLLEVPPYFSSLVSKNYSGSFDSWGVLTFIQPFGKLESGRIM